MIASQKAESYRPEIDGLRAVAVVAVIFNHINANLIPCGYLGVDVFFVISGYVITLSLIRSKHANMSDFLTSFYVRRIKRLLPALVTCVLVSSVLICLFDPNPIASIRTGVAALFGFSNLYLLRNSADYFGKSTDYNMFTQTWSLGVEEQFYLCFPMLMWLFALGRGSRINSTLLILFIGFALVSSLVGFLLGNLHNPSFAYFMPLTRIWEMAAGCLLALGVGKDISGFGARAKSFLSNGLLVVLVCLFFVPQQYGVATTTGVVLISCLLILTLNKSSRAFRMLTLRPVVFVGLISYSLYLWHWTVLCTSRWTVGIELKTIPFQILLMLGLAIASYLWIEQPLRRAKWSQNKLTTLVIGLSTALFSASILMLAEQRSEVFYTGSPAAHIDHSDFDSEVPSLTGRNLLAIGDSYTWHLKPMLHELHSLTGIGLNIKSIRGHDFPGVPFEDNRKSTLDQWFKNNQILQDFLDTRLDEMQNGDILLFSSRYERSWCFPLMQGDLRTRKVKFFDSNRNEKSRSRAYEAWIAELRAFLDTLQGRGIQVVFVAPIPFFMDDLPPSVLRAEWYNQTNKSKVPKQSKRKLENYFAPVNRVFTLLSDDYSFVTVFDPGSKIFRENGDLVQPVVDGVVLYKDESHLSIDASKILAPHFAEFLDSHAKSSAQPDA